MDTQIACPVCGEVCAMLDVVDFNKSCKEQEGIFLPLSGIPIYYFLCHNCQFCFAPEFKKWTQQDFEEKIYNSDYKWLDPDYSDCRPRVNAQSLINIFGNYSHKIRHLDYGGGGGLMSEILRKSNWQSTSYDKFVDTNISLSDLGHFDLVTAYEVFEHVNDVCDLMTDLSSVLSSDGMIFFTTMVSDNNVWPQQRLTWWYASPRNGHISIFSKKSLATLGSKYGFNFGSVSDIHHLYCRQIPSWARHFISVKQ